MKKIAVLALNILPFIIGLSLGLYFITLNITGTSFSYFPGDLGDARFNMYVLEHAHKFLTGQAESLWNAPFIFPEADIISYSDNLVGSAPLYSIFRIIGGDRETSFQWWFVLMAILSYSTCYLFLKNVFKNKYAAVLGAIVFAFSMALQSKMVHAQNFPRFPIPLAFWAAYLFIDDFKPKYFFVALLMVVYQLYCGIYLGLMLMASIGIMLILIILFNRQVLMEKLKDTKWLMFIGASVLVNILAILPLMLPYLKRAKEVGEYSYEGILSTVPTLKSFFFSSDGSIFWNFLNQTGINLPAWWDHQIFAGGIATLSILLLFFVTISKIINQNTFSKIKLDKKLLILALSGLVTFIFFIRFGDFSFYGVVFAFPGFNALRSLTRIINIELIFYSIAVAYLFSLIFKKQNLIAAVGFILLAGALIADNYFWTSPYQNEVWIPYRMEKQISQTRVNNLIAKMQDIPPNSVVSYEPNITAYDPNKQIEYQVDAMLACQTLNLKCVNGYTLTAPQGYADYWVEMSAESRKSWLKYKNFNSDNVYIVH
ncbi:MAG: hypothetical protein WC268_02265 [Patescibacteria group bacterium]|jgi:hypothetical protein